MNDEDLKEFKELFLEEAQDMLDETESLFLSLEKNPNDEETLSALFRLAHSFKGTGKSVGFDHLSEFAHELENFMVEIRNGRVEVDSTCVNILLKSCDYLQKYVGILQNDFSAKPDHSELIQSMHNHLNSPSQAHSKDSETQSSDSYTSKENENLAIQAETKSQNAKEESVRVSLKKIDELLNIFGEQMILQSVLDFAKEDFVENRELLFKTISQLNKLTSDLQQMTLSLRMVNLKKLFSKLERVARDTAQSLDKEAL